MKVLIIIQWVKKKKNGDKEYGLTNLQISQAVALEVSIY